MAPFILPLGSSAATLATAGGKGNDLSRLVRAGFPVPAGFVVTTTAYQAFVQANDLQPRMVGLAQRDPAAEVESISGELRSLFEDGAVPSSVAGEIGQAYAALGAERAVAVRSSATAEDQADASFAGQQETSLNVGGEQDLLRAVKRCWSSLWTSRAVSYRRRQGVDPGTVSLAVVVQVMVSASAAGVLFTANPLTGARDEVLIDAAWGLGDAVVSGLVTPDHITSDKATGLVKQMVVADKTVMTVPTSTGTELRTVEPGKRRAPVLDTAQIAQLVRLGSGIEEHYRQPQDIEWCLAGAQFWIVQSRPITTLPPEPIRWQSPLPGAKWLKDLQAGEWVTEPVSPLGADDHLRHHDRRPSVPDAFAATALACGDQRLVVCAGRLPAAVDGDRAHRVGDEPGQGHPQRAPPDAPHLARSAQHAGLAGGDRPGDATG